MADIGAKTQRYIVLRQFVSHEGTHIMGQKLPKHVDTDPVWNQSGLQSLVGSGFIYPVADDETYDRLPAHMYNAIKSQQELEGIIQVGESPVSFNEWVKPEEVAEVEQREADETASEERNSTHLAKRAVKQHEIANQPFVEARPVVVVHKIPAIDAMKEAAEQAADQKNSPEAERGDEVENQDNHDIGRAPEKTVEVNTEADGADGRAEDLDHVEPEHTEGPAAEDAVTVVPTAEDDVSDVREPTRNSYVGPEWTLKRLQETLDERGLTKTGNKAELVDRLREDDLKKG